MDFIIRQAVREDISQMCGLLSELFSIEADFAVDVEKQSRGLGLLVNGASGSSIVLVAEKAGEVVGMCSVQKLISTSEGGPVGLLEDLVVKKKNRGGGIGRHLLEAASNWCIQQNYLRLQLLRDNDNISALRFYEINGWKDTNLVCMRIYPDTVLQDIL